MPTSAQPEGMVDSSDGTTFLLLLDGGEPFDVVTHTDTDTHCHMSVSHFNAERLRMFIDKTGALLNSEGYRVHGVRLETSTPKAGFDQIPHDPRGGDATGGLLP